MQGHGAQAADVEEIGDGVAGDGGAAAIADDVQAAAPGAGVGQQLAQAFDALLVVEIAPGLFAEYAGADDAGEFPGMGDEGGACQHVSGLRDI